LKILDAKMHLCLIARKCLMVLRAKPGPRQMGTKRNTRLSKMLSILNEVCIHAHQLKLESEC